MSLESGYQTLSKNSMGLRTVSPVVAAKIAGRDDSADFDRMRFRPTDYRVTWTVS